MIETNPITPRQALVVDDNYYNRDLATLALKHVGFEVTHAENGLVAVEKLAEQSYDLMVLDLAMDGMDGISVLRYVRNTLLDRKLPVIVMTANPHMATDEVNDNADLVMMKPIDINEFALFADRVVK
jgi:two-component system sensor histidine kinase/response regulator